jgi:hypothetical protein
MAKSTDLQAASPQGPTDEQRSTAAETLARVAGHLASIDPDHRIDDIGFAVLVGAKLWDVALRTGVSGGEHVLHVALDAVGTVPSDMTRAELAVPVAQAAQALGYDWSADDNRRVIPTIPAPRRTTETTDKPHPEGVRR